MDHISALLFLLMLVVAVLAIGSEIDKATDYRISALFLKVMSSKRTTRRKKKPVAEAENLIAAPETTSETKHETVASAAADDITFPDLFTGLARLVHAGRVGETEALRLACGVSPGSSRAYQVARERLRAALGELPQVKPAALEKVGPHRYEITAPER